MQPELRLSFHLPPPSRPRTLLRQAEEFDGVVWGSPFWQVTLEDRINLALNCISLCMGVPIRSSLQAGTPRPRGLDFHPLLFTSVFLAGICPEWGWPVIGLGCSFSCCNGSKDLRTLGVQETEKDTAPHRAVNSPAKHKDHPPPKRPWSPLLPSALRVLPWPS